MLQDSLICNSSFKYICFTAYRSEIWRSVSNQRLCSWRSKLFVRWTSDYIKEILLHFTCRTVIWYSRLTFGIDRSVMKDTSAEEQTLSSQCVGFHWMGFIKNAHLSLYVYFMKFSVAVW